MKRHRTRHFFFLLALLLTQLTETNASSVAGQETLIGIVGQDFIVLGADTSISSSISLTSNSVDKIRVIIDPFPHNERRGVIHNNPDEQQQVIAVASAGDFADSERLIGYLINHASSMEYQHLGCDVKCVFNGQREGFAPTERDVNHHMYSPAGLDAESVSYLARGLISSSLRSRGQLKTCLLVAGMVRCYNQSSDHDTSTGPTSYHANDETFSQKLRHQIQAGTDTYTNSKHAIDDEKDIICHGVKNESDKSHFNPSERLHESQSVLKPRLFWLDEYGSLQKVEYAAHGLASNFVLSILDRKYESKLSKEEATALIMDCFRQLRKRFVINSSAAPCIKCIDRNGCELINVATKDM